jgi:hypothetical protein
MKELNRTSATPQEMIALVRNRPLEFKPGTKLAYTNTGYVLQRYPQEKRCIIVLSNLGSIKSWDIGDHIASILFGLPVAPSK